MLGKDAKSQRPQTFLLSLLKPLGIFGQLVKHFYDDKIWLGSDHFIRFYYLFIYLVDYYYVCC